MKLFLKPNLHESPIVRDQFNKEKALERWRILVKTQKYGREFQNPHQEEIHAPKKHTTLKTPVFTAAPTFPSGKPHTETLVCCWGQSLGNTGPPFLLKFCSF